MLKKYNKKITIMLMLLTATPITIPVINNLVTIEASAISEINLSNSYETAESMNVKWVQYSPGIWSAYEASTNKEIYNGWIQTSPGEVYFIKDGVMQKGWIQLNSGKWVFLKNGNTNISNTNFKEGQVVRDVFVYSDPSTSYYLKSDGYMAEGWYEHSPGVWSYYIPGNGKKVVNTSMQIGSKLYYFDSNGVCTNPY